MTKRLLCIDCKWVELGEPIAGSVHESALCARPGLMYLAEVSLVDGREFSPELRRCDKLRSDSNDCGFTAMYWMSKEVSE